VNGTYRYFFVGNTRGKVPENCQCTLTIFRYFLYVFFAKKYLFVLFAYIFRSLINYIIWYYLYLKSIGLISWMDRWMDDIIYPNPSQINMSQRNHYTY
jgi:hypothetical protein